MSTVVAKDEMGDGEFTDELQPGTTLLQGQFVIEGFLNSGGFGMTYLAKDSLERTVVIKECFPASVCTRAENNVRARSRAHQKDFRSIVRLFLQEARQLAKLRHPNIVGVHQVFEDNETAYMALDFVDGLDMLDIIEENARRITPDALHKILVKILDAVGFMHSQNILHRDISPDNILIDVTGNPVLIDFGAAREEATKTSRAMSALLVVKDGYSPQEFYISGSDQGPFSDLYALAASIYHLMAGMTPPHSQSRLAAIAEQKPDPYEPISQHVIGYRPDFLAAIDKAMSIFPKDRFQSAQEWLHAFEQGTPVETSVVPVSDAEFDQTISQLVTETNIAVEKAIETTVEKPEAVEKAVPVSKLREKFADIARELAMDAEPEDEPSKRPVKISVSRVLNKGKIDRAERLRNVKNQEPISVTEPNAEPSGTVPETEHSIEKSSRRKWFKISNNGQTERNRIWPAKRQKPTKSGKANP
ncbi:MAG: serine/threonine-protein kinase [Paracoccaceae bacterium]